MTGVRNLSPEETRTFKKLGAPAKVQDFLNAIPNNFETAGETCMSPRRVLRERKAHCIEGALFAAAAFLFHGRPALVMHFGTDRDEDHVIALFRENGLWGAVSKSNHSLMRYRDPVYKTSRELALSYFNEYFMYEDGRKTLRGYTKPIDLKKFGTAWVTDEKELWKLNDALFDARHFPIAPPKTMKKLRPVDPIEIAITKITNWKKK
ncbi:MAG: hypothetical protein Q8Q36_02950 [bacterium]|nr:hypothetical protein [bacterium]